MSDSDTKWFCILAIVFVIGTVATKIHERQIESNAEMAMLRLAVEQYQAGR